uniref:Uncharacterized protein n=1 Tax=Candidatus Kentrum eta TaxID=2126337 RepID=A0A450VRW0_9GAMM|nr:MAG: hypothetical protein BECKH772B_GA0070898_104252 [Candidatus Kentron sp. H]VFK04473.1 MAG: hypothetical protein BECKH772A_GA0070896_104202 [Candidatus Kentron sp. H]VFK07519.1 MAG: hypothetical protein BECKH772C_GA0070978_104282 [Candidatus Kentron sp. H]
MRQPPSLSSSSPSPRGFRPRVRWSQPIPVTRDTENEKCAECHGVEGFAVPLGEDGAAKKRHLSFNVEAFAESVHGKQKCVECHSDIEQLPHREDLQRAVDCVECHTERWREIRDDPKRYARANGSVRPSRRPKIT